MAQVRSKKVIAGFISLISVAVTTIALMVTFTLSLFVKEAESEGFYGEVSLRSYFECGSGRPRGTNGESDPGDPYVITRPRHMYNLSRLQGLGVFGENTYFQLGLVGLGGDNSGQPLCYLDDYSSTTVPFLDMSDSDYDNEPINAIGSEAVPFYGEFDGQGLEIKNITVYADPEDAGLFGYTAHGSNVHDLFLTNVTINALGYADTDIYNGLYGTNAAATGTSFIYNYSNDTPVTFTSSDTDVFKELVFDASAIFNWDGISEEPTINDPAPIITYNTTNGNYRYKTLISGDLLVDLGNGQIGVDLPTLYKFFKKEKTEASGSTAIQASSSISLVASTTDNYGLDHSKVVMNFEFDFSLGSITSNYINMTARLGTDHSNNIGLVIGHCDGSVIDCYVYGGKFVMNNGTTITGNTYNTMSNGSTLGLIGLIGSTVHNIAAEESDAGTSAGKDIGVLDFTTIYDDVIGDSSFTGSQTLEQGVTYTPKSTNKYYDYLRKDNAGNYVTLAANTVSFNRQKVIANSDLGIFTVATNQSGTGMNEDAGNGLDVSVVKKEDVSSGGSSYYVYYETGEYDSTKGIAFSEYRDSIQSDNPTQFHPGYHLPYYDTVYEQSQITSESFEQRDRHQNYIFRFKVEGNSRTGRGFYFSDVDKTKTGGDFISKYFENKLVDQNGNKIPASANSNRSGVMLRNSLGQEIRKFSASFATPDLSYVAGTAELLKPKMYCVSNTAYDNPAANMVNFEVKTNMANVTVVAGLVDVTKPAALGVYKIDGVQRQTIDNTKYLNIDYESPNYAFFMPTDDHLAYFDYGLDEQGKYQIGHYNNAGKIEPADGHTEATLPKMYNAGAETGYDTGSGKPRLFAHTFKLPKGRYCLGSATGEHRGVEGYSEGIAKIYYVCAQGQTDGQITFNDNAFASKDEVKNIDFTKVPRFTYSAGVVTENITIGGEDVTTYDSSDKRVDNQRCYVSLTNSDRSLFDDALCNVEFVYEDGKFKIKSTTLGAIIYMSVSSYAASHNIENLPTTPVVLLDQPSVVSDDPIIYPAPTP